MTQKHKIFKRIAKYLKELTIISINNASGRVFKSERNAYYRMLRGWIVYILVFRVLIGITVDFHQR